MNENLMRTIKKGLANKSVMLGKFEQIPAKRTNGFKSNAEHQFSMFCSSRGIEHYYEPYTFIRSFNTIDGLPLCYAVGRYQYTPDFFLPDWDLFVEIKAQDERIAEDIFDKYREFGAQLKKEHGARYAVLNLGFDTIGTQLEFTNFGHPDDEGIDQKILNYLLEVEYR